jgi:biopolymer transport protein ExbD
MITKDQLFVQGELVANVGDIRDARTQMIAPLRQVLDRPMISADGSPEELDPAAREITVMGDKTLPYDVVRKVMATCTAAAYGKISLAVMRKEEPIKAGGESA